MGKRKIKKKVLIILISVVILIVLGILFLLYNSFNIKLNGSKIVKVEVNTKYKDKGCKSIGKIKTIGKVNSKKLGSYTITYKVKYLFFEKSVSRKVKVIDSTKPTIKLKGDIEINMGIGDEYKEEGYEVSDNYDKNLDKKVKVKNNIDNSKEGSYEVVYSVEDSSHNKSKITRKVNVSSSNNRVGTYIKGILIVNKKYHLPSDYNPGVDPVAGKALEKLQSGAKSAGFNIPLLSGFRSYTTQERLYNNYVARDGVEKASTYSAKPGQSEHQSGLAFDIGELSDTYGETPAGRWLSENAHKYGFIIRYMKGKENITGYQYEPWHVRYVGENVAKDIYKKDVTLEEYLGVN